MFPGIAASRQDLSGGDRATPCHQVQAVARAPHLAADKRPRLFMTTGPASITDPLGLRRRDLHITGRRGALFDAREISVRFNHEPLTGRAEVLSKLTTASMPTAGEH
jgi:hypothetical protein